MKRLLARAINKNQVLILRSIDGKKVTELLASISETHKIPLSTLKLNAKVLRELGIMDWNQAAELTDLGRLVKRIMCDDNLVCDDKVEK